MTVAEIIKFVCDAACDTFGLVNVDIRKLPRRNDSVLHWARHLAMYWLWEKTGLSLPNIARVMGVGDHTTVLYGRNQTRRRLAENEQFAESVRKMEEALMPHIKTYQRRRTSNEFVFPTKGVMT